MKHALYFKLVVLIQAFMDSWAMHPTPTAQSRPGAVARMAKISWYVPWYTLSPHPLMRFFCSKLQVCSAWMSAGIAPPEAGSQGCITLGHFLNNTFPQGLRGRPFNIKIEGAALLLQHEHLVIAALPVLALACAHGLQSISQDLLCGVIEASPTLLVHACRAARTAALQWWQQAATTIC